MYAVLGASGFLGSYLVKSILAGTDEDVLAVSRSVINNDYGNRVRFFPCDITNQEQVKALAKAIAEGERCKFIDLAFRHNIDTVDKYPRDSWHTNITSLSVLRNDLENIECFFFASTDCVYGEGNPGQRFKEEDSLRPISLYGTQKAAAECLVRTKGFHVLRLPYMFGPSLVPGKAHFYDVIKKNLAEDKETELFTDSMRSALDFESVADLIVRLTQIGSPENIPQTMNLCGDEALSEYDLGILLAEKLGKNTKLLRPVPSSTLATDINARRALNGLMDNTLLKSFLGIEEIRIKI